MLGRHYWPQGSLDSAGALMRTAGALHRVGLHVEVVTARFASSWPDSITVKEVVVRRVVAAPRSDWTMGRYVRGLTSWLQQHAGSYDVLFVDSLREEAIAAVAVAAHHGIKTILCCRGWGELSDAAWWKTGRSARRCASAARLADVVVAHSAACERSLVIEGVDPIRIERVVSGFDAFSARSAARSREARRALAEVNRDLYAEPDAPVALCITRMIHSGGLERLVRASHTLVARYPNLRLWFVGDGPYRETMYEQLRSDGIRASIAMPGSFSDTEDLYAAADVYLQPDEDGLEFLLPNAISSGLPIVAVQCDSVRGLLDGGPLQGQSVPRDRPSDLIEWCDGSSGQQLCKGISGVLDDLSSARERAERLRRLMLRTRPYSETIDCYARMIERLASQINPRRRSQEAEVVS